MEYYNELYHHGIKGMKWGIRRYQNKDGSLTPAGEKRRAKLEGKLEKLNGKLKKTTGPDEDIEVRKQKILESRSAKQLYDNANLFTFNELQAAKMRLELERNLKNLEPEQVSKGEAAVNKFVKSSDKASEVIQSGSKLYNNVAKVFNAFYGNKNGMSLPMIDDKKVSKLDKFKEETEWQKAKNERKKALEEAKEKQKTDLDKLKEETAWIDAQNRNREAKRASRAHDDKDRREAEKREKEAKSNSNASSPDTSTVNRGQTASSSAMSNLPALPSHIPSSTVNSGRSAAETIVERYNPTTNTWESAGTARSVDD